MNLRETMMVAVCHLCNAVFRESWDPAGASGAVRLTRRQIEQVLEDFRLQRQQLEKDIGKHSCLYVFMRVTPLTALLWGRFGWARTIISPTMTLTGDDMLAVILLGRTHPSIEAG